jgi:putative sterol carrier protein
MTFPVFSDAWAAACAEVLNRNPTYREVAATWEAAILLHMVAEDGGGGARRVFLDLWRGECRMARAATSEDEAAARYILAGSRTAWHELLSGRLPPLVAILTGRLKLAKGSLTELMPHVNAAKALVGAATAVPVTFPEEE